MNEVSTLTVLTDRGQPVVRAALDGLPVSFVVDTGATVSTVTTAVADRAGLPVDYDRRATFDGLGGSTFVYGAHIRLLSFGTAKARDMEFWRADRPSGTVAGLPIGGLFGADFLANYDVLFDLPNHRIRLFRAQNCGGDIVPPLSDPLVETTFELDDNHVIIPVKVNGHAIRAVLDSGASWTILNMDDALATGVTRAQLREDRQVSNVGIDGRYMASAIHEFDTLEIGGETRRPARLSVGDIESNTLIGDDFFRRNQVWISYPHRTMFFHPVGAITVLPPGTGPSQSVPFQPGPAGSGSSSSPRLPPTPSKVTAAR